MSSNSTNNNKAQVQPQPPITVPGTNSISPYGPMESAFQQCGAPITQVAYGPCSKVIGSPMQRFPGWNGQCVGAFLSNWVDVAEQDVASCLYNENQGVFAYQQDPSEGMRYWGSTPARVTYQADTPTNCSGQTVCGSFGTYSAAPNSTLSCGIVGNTLLGQSAENWCTAQKIYNPPFMNPSP